MRLKHLALLAVVGFILISAPAAQAQISFGVQIGGGYPEPPAGPPVCQYGYYANPPYACAPVGYYGPEWFNGGAFIGAGPWYQNGWGYRDGWGHREGWDHDHWDHGRGGWGGGRGYVGGGFHGGGGGFHGHGGGGFHGGGRGGHR